MIRLGMDMIENVRRRFKSLSPYLDESIHVFGQVVLEIYSKFPNQFPEVFQGIQQLAARVGQADARSVRLCRSRSKALARTIRRRITATTATLWHLPLPLIPVQASNPTPAGTGDT